MIYLGTPGRMVGVKCPSRQVVEDMERHSFTTTLEGKRLAQVTPAKFSARSWSLDVSVAKPDQVAVLSAFARGAWGDGPFTFVAAGAHEQNLLTPLGSWCMQVVSSGASHGGPVVLPDGSVAPESLLSGSAQNVYVENAHAPVRQGVPVTLSAWVRGAGARVGAAFFSGNGMWISTVSSPTVTGDDWQRAHVTVVPPLTAGAVRLVMIGGEQITLPQVTWTQGVVDWAEGEGCPAAVVSPLSRDVLRALPSAHYTNLGFTVTEVG